MNTPCKGGYPMKAPDDRVCGAKTRAGTPCKNWGLRPGGRCRMHGGKSLQGFASPTFKHGWYSRVEPYPTWKRVILAKEAQARRREALIAAARERWAAKDRKQSERAQRMNPPKWDDATPQVLLAPVTGAVGWEADNGAGNSVDPDAVGEDI